MIHRLRSELQAAIAHTAEQDAFAHHKAALDKQMDDIKAKFRQREAEIQKQYDVRVEHSVVCEGEWHSAVKFVPQVNLATIRQRDEHEISSLKAELSAARAKIDSLTTDIHERTSTITQLEQDLRRLQDRLHDASEAHQNAATDAQLLVSDVHGPVTEG